MFTTWTFWIGAAWGFGIGFVALYYWLVRPMARQLGMEPHGKD